jgi:mRNA-degrading endonuclease RelE of RelBE toxin-antitoxin system
MSNERQISFSSRFIRETKELRKKYRRIDEDIKAWIEQLKRGETPGDLLQGTGDYVVYKARLGSRDMQRGKSGGFRVIYYLKTETNTIMLSIYAKTEHENIPTSEIIDSIDETLNELSDEPPADANDETPDNPEQ